MTTKTHPAFFLGLLLPSVAALCLSSCASIVSKSSRPVTISSNPSGATYTLKQSNGMVMSEGTTPATVVLSTSRGFFQPAEYIIEFKRKGAVRTVPLNASINGWYFGNFLLGFGGFLGLIIVDPATGAMWRLDETVVTNFNQTALNTRTLEIRTIDQISPVLRKHLVALN